MAKVTVHEDAMVEAVTPTNDIVRRAILEETLTDAGGRSIKVRKPGPLAQFRIVEAAGPEAAANQTYMQMINPLIYVCEIDGLPVHLPMNKREIEGLINQLGEDGLGAVMGWYIEKIVVPGQEAMELAEQKARLKNS